eukprot:3337610-Pleurochrysis_carterae.AAC.1
MTCVLLRALQAHSIQPPPPGPGCHETAVRLLLSAVKKRGLPSGALDGSDILADDDGVIDVDGNTTDDTGSEMSLTSARARNKQQRRLSSRSGKGVRGAPRGGGGRGRGCGLAEGLLDKGVTAEHMVIEEGPESFFNSASSDVRAAVPPAAQPPAWGDAQRAAERSIQE